MTILGNGIVEIEPTLLHTDIGVGPPFNYYYYIPLCNIAGVPNAVVRMGMGGNVHGIVTQSDILQAEQDTYYLAVFRTPMGISRYRIEVNGAKYLLGGIYMRLASLWFSVKWRWHVAGWAGGFAALNGDWDFWWHPIDGGGDTWCFKRVLIGVQPYVRIEGIFAMPPAPWRWRGTLRPNGPATNPWMIATKVNFDPDGAWTVASAFDGVNFATPAEIAAASVTQFGTSVCWWNS